MTIERCHECDGRGTVWAQTCPKCCGRGFIEIEDEPFLLLSVLAEDTKP